MKRILFYYPSNKRSIQIETTLLELKKLGYSISLLSTCEKGKLHESLEENGIPTHVHVSKYSISPLYYLDQIFFLKKFCKQQKIDIVFSNLQHANFITAFARFILKARVIAFRHHFKFSQGQFGIPLEINKNEQRFDKVINALAKEIIVPSKGVYDGMVQHEKVDLKKVSIIPYLYDFSKYGKPNAENVEKIKNTYKAKLRIIMVARLIPFKRHQLMFPIYKKLIEEGLDIQVLILDEGQEEQNLKSWIKENEMESYIHMLGFRRDFLDHMKASDLLIHPSLTEASNNVVKEIGLMKKTVAVCKGVGDFDEYIIDQENGFFLNIEKPEKDAYKLIKKVYDNPGLVDNLGEKLNDTILTKFGSNEVVLQQYIELIEGKAN